MSDIQRRIETANKIATFSRAEERFYLDAAGKLRIVFPCKAFDRPLDIAAIVDKATDMLKRKRGQREPPIGSTHHHLLCGLIEYINTGEVYTLDWWEQFAEPHFKLIAEPTLAIIRQELFPAKTAVA